MERRTRLKTYSHLSDARKIPSEYEIVTSRLLYYPEKGFEVLTPVTEWYQKYQKDALLSCKDWNHFEDPRATTYTDYTSLQKIQETFVDRLLVSFEEANYIKRLPLEWVIAISLQLGVLRYPYHALQMCAAYLGQLAPASRLTITFLFQASDEMRKIQRFSYLLAVLQKHNPQVAELAKAAWQHEAKWQPLRRLIENLLVTYSWSEALVALNLCVKPAMDELFLRATSENARTQGDYVLAEILLSLQEDSVWQQRWTRSLLELLSVDLPENSIWIHQQCERWNDSCRVALSDLAVELKSSEAQISAPGKKLIEGLLPMRGKNDL
jgi:toluene monooxygenase system protein E